MTRVRFTLNLIATITFVLVFAMMAQAQATRTWVSGVGDDVNPCSRTAPCKTYAGAISKTAKDGEISTLDPGGFGTLTITKSITVNGGGGGQGYGSVLSALAPQGFLINITDAADVRKTVRIVGLDINGASSGTDGIRFIAGNALHVENTNIDGLTGDGIEVNAPATGSFELFVNKTSIRNCATNGIRLASAGATVNASIDSSQITNNGNGVDVQGGTLNISNSNISGNTSAGLTAGGAVGSVLNVRNCVVTMNANGIVSATAVATVRISGNDVFRNTSSGLLVSAGVMETVRNNRVRGNGANLTGALTDVSAVNSGTF